LVGVFDATAHHRQPGLTNLHNATATPGMGCRVWQWKNVAVPSIRGRCAGARFRDEDARVSVPDGTLRNNHPSVGPTSRPRRHLDVDDEKENQPSWPPPVTAAPPRNLPSV